MAEPAEYVTHSHLRRKLAKWMRRVEEGGVRVVIWDRHRGKARCELVIAEQPEEPPADEEIYL
jgi:hypothetical protein